MVKQLPHESDKIYYIDGGLETTLVFLDGMELPAFASFPLVDSEVGRERLRVWYRDYLDIAAQHDVGFILEAPLWRAHADWGPILGYDSEGLDRVNREALAFTRALATESSANDVIVGANIGPRGDGYVVTDAMSAAEATRYHRPQMRSLAAGCCELVSALTITYAEEAMGIAQAGADFGLPVVISFTLETDGKLPSGETLGDAIERVDAAVPGAVAYYMVNCVHPIHFEKAIESGAPWLSRLRGLRANASTRSHAELDASTELDRGDPDDLATRYAGILARLPEMNVLGGCCGTDREHMAAITSATQRSALPAA
jgi:homocysteine S-methyltransferase